MPRKKSTKKNFIVATSTCGDLSQAYTGDTVHTFHTIKAAKNAASDIMETHAGEQCNDVSDIEAVYVMEVVAQGSRKPDVNWQ